LTTDLSSLSITNEEVGNQLVTTDDEFVQPENKSSDKDSSASGSESDDSHHSNTNSSNSNQSSNSASDSDRSNPKSDKEKEESKPVEKKPTKKPHRDESSDESVLILRKSQRNRKKPSPAESSGEESTDNEAEDSPKISSGKSTKSTKSNMVKPSGLITPAMKKKYNIPQSDEDETKIVTIENEKKSSKNVVNEGTEESVPTITKEDSDQRRSPRFPKNPTSTNEKKEISSSKPKEVSPTNPECNTAKRLVRTAIPLSEIKDWMTSKEVSTLDELKQRCKEYSWKNCKITEQQLENWEIPRAMCQLLLVKDPKAELVRYGLFGIKRRSRIVELEDIKSSMNITNFCICCCNGSNNQRDAYTHDIQHGASYEDLLRFSKTDPTTSLLKFPETSFVMTITKKVASMLTLKDKRNVARVDQSEEPTGFTISNETEEGELAESEEGRDSSQEKTIVDKKDGESEEKVKNAKLGDKGKEKKKKERQEKKKRKQENVAQKEKGKEQLEKHKKRDKQNVGVEKSKKVDSKKTSCPQKKTDLKPSEKPSSSKTKTTTSPNRKASKISKKTSPNPSTKSFGEVLLEVPESKTSAKDSRKRKSSLEKERNSKKSR
jgi:hypothetical protein